jgi:hypothetical protein
MSNEAAKGPVRYYSGTDHEGGNGSRAMCRTSPASWGGPEALHVDDYGAATLDALERSSCHLPLLMVVNTAMVGLVATLVFATVELATHVLT